MENVLFRREGTEEGEARNPRDAANFRRRSDRRGEILPRREDRDGGFGIRTICRVVGSDRRGDRREIDRIGIISSAGSLEQSFHGSSGDQRESSRSRADGGDFQAIEGSVSATVVGVQFDADSMCFRSRFFAL